MKYARISLQVEQAVGLPIAVRQFSDDVPCQFRSTPHALDLVFEGPELLPLSRLDERSERAEHAVKTPVAKTIFDSVGVHDTLAPVVACLEPPRFLALRPGELSRIRKSPISKLGTYKRLLAGGEGIAMGAEQPLRPSGKGLNESIPANATVRERSIVMVVGDIGADVKARRNRGVVDHKSRRIVCLEPGIEGTQPLPMLGIVDEIDAPVLVDDGPADDRGVVVIPVDNAPQHALFARP